jgi:hypothetical protein
VIPVTAERGELGQTLQELIPLRDSQLALLGVLLEKDESVAKMYAGALMARSFDTNPDYLSQACHSIRELIDNLPKYFEVPIQRTDSLTNKVNALRAAWDREPRVRISSAEALSERFAVKVAEFFQWHEAQFPTRREVARNTVRELSTSSRLLPHPIETLRAEEWMKIRDWFIGATHHGACSEDEFDQWLDVFESFMLNLSKPRPFDNADVIDALIRKGESDG